MGGRAVPRRQAPGSAGAHRALFRGSDDNSMVPACWWIDELWEAACSPTLRGRCAGRSHGCAAPGPAAGDGATVEAGDGRRLFPLGQLHHPGLRTRWPTSGPVSGQQAEALRPRHWRCGGGLWLAKSRTWPGVPATVAGQRPAGVADSACSIPWLIACWSGSRPSPRAPWSNTWNGSRRGDCLQCRPFSHRLAVTRKALATFEVVALELAAELGPILTRRGASNKDTASRPATGTRGESGNWTPTPTPPVRRTSSSAAARDRAHGLLGQARSRCTVREAWGRRGGGRSGRTGGLETPTMGPCSAISPRAKPARRGPGPGDRRPGSASGRSALMPSISWSSSGSYLLLVLENRLDVAQVGRHTREAGRTETDPGMIILVDQPRARGSRRRDVRQVEAAPGERVGAPAVPGRRVVRLAVSLGAGYSDVEAGGRCAPGWTACRSPFEPAARRAAARDHGQRAHRELAGQVRAAFRRTTGQ